MPTVIILLAVFTLAAGRLMVGMTSFIKRLDERVSYRAQISASEFGLKLAEDWLISSIEDGFVPKRVPDASGDFLYMIEAVRPDGGRVSHDLGFDNFGVSLFVADTDYGDDVEDLLQIPLIPESFTPNEGRLRCYFLSSTAETARWRPKLVCEELLAVSLDLSGRVQSVTRLFYRSN
jgi:hypothetical protein